MTWRKDHVSLIHAYISLEEQAASPGLIDIVPFAMLEIRLLPIMH